MLFDDFHPEVEGEPSSYSWSALGPVIAAPIVGDSTVLGYVFHGLGEESGSAGTIELSSDERAVAACRFWDLELESMFRMGLSARDAVASLLERSDEKSATRIGPDLDEYPGKRYLDELLNPEVYARRRHWKEERSQRLQGFEQAADSRPGREQIDAALRGQEPMTPAIAVAVRHLDEALAIRPVPEPLMVSVLWKRSDLPEALEVGVRTVEPAFMLSYFTPPDHPFPDAEVRMHLRLEPGTPALFQDPQESDGPGILLLGRGLEWEVLQIVPLPDHLAVFARTVSRHPVDIGTI